jgi:hypothetical protein
MRIEYGFRNGKSHLGRRGLDLEVDKSQRLLGLQMGFTWACRFTLLLGQDRSAQPARPFFERPRRSAGAPPAC